MPWFRWLMGIRPSLVSLAGSDSGQLGTKWVVKTLILTLSSLPTEDPNVSLLCGVWLWGWGGSWVWEGSRQRTQWGWRTLQGVVSVRAVEFWPWVHVWTKLKYAAVRSVLPLQPWATWMGRSSMGSRSVSRCPSTRQCSCPVRTRRTMAWPRTMALLLYIVSRNQAPKISKTSFPLLPLFICPIFRKYPQGEFLLVWVLKCLKPQRKGSSVLLSGELTQLPVPLSCHAKRLLVGNLEKSLSVLRLPWSVTICLTAKIFCFRPSVTEEDLKLLFSSNGGIVKGFKFFQ